MSAYKVEDICGCRIISPLSPGDGLPMDALSKESSHFGHDAKMDMDLSRLYGAFFVIGTKENLDLLKSHPETERRRESLKKTMPSTTPPELVNWFANGEVGLSSKAIVYHLLGLPEAKSSDFIDFGHPSDPADLRRCLLLLEAVPSLKDDLHKMSAVSPVWDIYIKNWSKMIELFEEEVPDWDWPDTGKSRSAPRTYDFMRYLQTQALDEDTAKNRMAP